MILRQEQKSVECMMDLVSELQNVGGLEQNNNTASMETVKARLWRSEHGRFGNFENYSACF